jgi:hypothetical protein
LCSGGRRSRGFQLVVFESYSQTLVSALNKDHKYDLAPISVLLREIRNTCVSSFEAVDFTFCPRNCKRVTHELARFGMSADSDSDGLVHFAPDCDDCDSAARLSPLKMQFRMT